MGMPSAIHALKLGAIPSASRYLITIAFGGELTGVASPPRFAENAIPIGSALRRPSPAGNRAISDPAAPSIRAQAAVLLIQMPRSVVASIIANSTRRGLRPTRRRRPRVRVRSRRVRSMPVLRTKPPRNRSVTSEKNAFRNSAEPPGGASRTGASQTSSSARITRLVTNSGTASVSHSAPATITMPNAISVGRVMPSGSASHPSRAAAPATIAVTMPSCARSGRRRTTGTHSETTDGTRGIAASYQTEVRGASRDVVRGEFADPTSQNARSSARRGGLGGRDRGHWCCSRRAPPVQPKAPVPKVRPSAVGPTERSGKWADRRQRASAGRTKREKPRHLCPRVRGADTRVVAPWSSLSDRRTFVTSVSDPRFGVRRDLWPRAHAAPAPDVRDTDVSA